MRPAACISFDKEQQPAIPVLDSFPILCYPYPVNLKQNLLLSSALLLRGAAAGF